MSDVAVSDVTIPRTDPEPNGIGGWLLFFLLSFSVASPILLMKSSLAYFHAAGRFHRPVVVTVYEIASWSELLLAISYIAVGFLIFNKKPQAHKAVPLALWIGALWGVTLWCLHWMLPLDAPLRQVWAEKMLFPMFQRICYATIWTSYWLHSERVANTFGDSVTGN